ncbi:MAG: NUMOD3 domain-containing DNA-binding protein [Culicoidibacterales bacterium]
MLNQKSNNQSRHKANSRAYESCRRHRARHLSIDVAGENNPFYGKTHSPEVVARIKAKNIGRKQSDETRMKKSVKLRGKKKTEEHKSKIGRPNLIMLIKDGHCVRISKEESHTYITQGYENPYTSAMKKSTTFHKCPHCSKTSKSIGNMKRWHFNNCKEKQ